MLFNKTINSKKIGNQEVKALIGFSSASLSFDSLQPFILSDEMRIKQIIGEIYAAAQSYYSSAEYNPDLTSSVKLDQLVHKIQASHIFIAYLEFVKNNDLSHSDSGRKVMTGDQEKMPWEWMIEADNRALFSKGYNALNALLYFLEENSGVTGFTAWKDSQQRKRLRGQLVYTTGQFEAVFPINGSLRFFMVVQPFMRDIERNIIIPVVGRERYNALLTKVKEAATLDEADLELLAVIRHPLVYYTLEQALWKLADQEMPETILRTYLPDSVNQKKAFDQKKDQRIVFRDEADRSLIILQDYIARLNDAAALPQTAGPINEKSNKFFTT